MVKKSFLALVAVLLIASGLWANGLNLNGVGTKAISMGGAFIGLADDYSAVFWNPAGLSQLTKPQFFLFETNIVPSGTYAFSFEPYFSINAQTLNKVYPSGAIGYLHPINDKLLVGITAYVPSGIGATWPGEELAPLAKGVYEWESLFGIITVAPVIAYKLSDSFSVGATFNLNYGFMDVKRPMVGQYSEKVNGTTFGVTFGGLLKLSQKVSVGMTVRTPSKVKFKGTAEMPAASNLGLATESEIERDATWPLWIGMGIAVKPTSKLTLTADVQYTEWKILQTIPACYTDPGWDLYFTEAGTFQLGWDDRFQVRFGAEYAFNKNWAIRGGYYYDPSPSPVYNLNILLPEISYNAASFGFGYSSSKISLDLCVEILQGKQATVPFPNDLGSGMPGTHGMDILAPNFAFTYRF